MICNTCGHKLPNDSEFCQYCGSKIEDVGEGSRYAETNAVKFKQPRTVMTTNNISMVLVALSIVLIVWALNIQDIKRNTYEELNPTLLYFTSLCVNIVCIFLMFLAKGPKSNLIKNISALLTACVSIAMLLEGTLTSDSYYLNGSRNAYRHANVVSTLNVLWITISLAVLVINLLPPIKNLWMKWQRSVRYRENCYKRVAKMKDYLEKGIINQEEFEKTRQEILKNIEK